MKTSIFIKSKFRKICDTIMSDEDIKKISLAASKLSLALELSNSLENEEAAEKDNLNKNDLEKEFEEYYDEQEKINREYRSEIDADEVLKEMVARKVDIQNTAYNLDTSAKIISFKEELKISTENLNFDDSKSTKSKLRREIRKKELESLSKRFEERLKELKHYQNFTNL